MRQLFFTLVLLLLVPLAMSEPLPMGATMEVHGISVMKKMPPPEDDNGVIYMTSVPEGTAVSLLIQVPEHSIIDLDETASKLSKFVDDKNTDLLKRNPQTGRAATGAMRDMTMGFLEQSPLRTNCISPSKKWIILDCVAPNQPTSGTQTVALEGKIVLQCGKGTKTTEHKNISLNGKGKFDVGEIRFNVEKAKESAGVWFGQEDEWKMQISLLSNKSLDSIISYTFLDAEGKEIKSKEFGWWGMGNQRTTNFSLAKEVDSVSIRVVEYETMETVTLPFSLTVGLGL